MEERERERESARHRGREIDRGRERERKRERESKSLVAWGGSPSGRGRRIALYREERERAGTHPPTRDAKAATLDVLHYHLPCTVWGWRLHICIYQVFRLNTHKSPESTKITARHLSDKTDLSGCAGLWLGRTEVWTQATGPGPARRVARRARSVFANPSAGVGLGV